VTTEERLEIEVKIRVAAAETWRHRLAACGAEAVAPRQLERDQVYDTPAGDLGGRGMLLRLRRCGDACVLTLKEPPPANDPAFKVRRETEVQVSDFTAMERVLLAVGLQPRFAYEKYRETFALDGALVLLDETPIGTFLEIEGEPGAIDRAAARLGFSRSDYLRDSYRSLFLLAGGRGDMLFGR